MIGFGQLILQDKTAVQTFHGRHIVPACQESVKPRSIKRSRLSRVILGRKYQNWSRHGLIRLRGSRFDVLRNSGTDRITDGGLGVHVSRKVTQLARQTGNFEPDIEVMEGVFVKESTTVTPS